MTDRILARKAAAEPRRAANEDLKRSFSSWFWGSIIAATVVHFLAFAAWPTMSVAVADTAAPETPILHIPTVDVSKPPPPIDRPAIPVASREIGGEVTVPDIVFDHKFSEPLPPPPDQMEDPALEAPHWTPVDVLPYIRNRDEVTRALAREYPPLFRDAGIGGTTRLWFYVDETGKVIRTQVHTPSAHRPLDEAALRIAHLYEFAPALHRDKPVAVWVSLDVTFRPR